MDEKAFTTIEREIDAFVRRIILSDKRRDKLDRSTYILLGLLQEQGPISVKSLADHLSLDVSTVSRQTSGMEKKDLAKRLPNPVDGRSYFYQITEKGNTALEDHRKARYELINKAFADWSNEESKTFGELLSKYNRTMRERL